MWMWVARQLALPTGPVGGLIVALMTRGNRRINAFALAQLAIGSADRVLEVGFGGGPNLGPLCERAAHVTGLDPSATVHARASARFAEILGRGRLTLRVGRVDAIPAADATFDAVLTVNTIYFWSDRPRSLAEILRVLAPGGRLVIGLHPGARMEEYPTEVFTRVDPDVLCDELVGAGFVEVAVRRPEEADFVCVGARKPPAR